MRVEKYFAYKHLPEHLQSVSKPFADCVQNITLQSVNTLFNIVHTSMSASNDKLETSIAVHKLTTVLQHIVANDGIDTLILQQLILEAKDCCVRAAIK